MDPTATHWLSHRPHADSCLVVRVPNYRLALHLSAAGNLAKGKLASGTFNLHRPVDVRKRQSGPEKCGETSGLTRRRLALLLGMLSYALTRFSWITKGKQNEPSLPRKKAFQCLGVLGVVPQGIRSTSQHCWEFLLCATKQWATQLPKLHWNLT